MSLWHRMIPFMVLVGLALGLHPATFLSFRNSHPHPTQHPHQHQHQHTHRLLSSRRLASTESVPTETAPKTHTQSATIIGAGPAGLATAIMLAQRGMDDIHVYERLAAPAASDDAVWSDTAKFYLIGLGGRGQKALQELVIHDGSDDDGNGVSQQSVWDRVEEKCVTVLGRKDWAPGAGVDEGVERIFGDDRPYKTKVIPRDRLAGVLREVVLDSYGDAVSLHYDTEMTSVRWEDTEGEETAVVSLRGEEEVDVRCGLLVGADGTARTLATALESHTDGAVSVIRYPDDNRRVYKTVPLTLPSDTTSDTTTNNWRADVNYSARTRDGRVILDALPANTHGEYCAVLLLTADDEFAQPNSNPEGLRALINATLPQFSPLITDVDLDLVARKAPSNIPRFRYVGPTLHSAGSTVLLGDAIHTVKPYFGLGVNSALEDVTALRDAMDAHPTQAEALAAYSEARAEESKALVRISRGLDRPGFLGFLTFILPIILDGVFAAVPDGFLGYTFEPNTIALLQRDGISFAEVGRLKRRDRVVQALVLVSGGVIISNVVGALLALVTGGGGGGNNSGTVPIVGGVLLAVLASQVLRVWEPGMAPADVLAKTLQPVTDVITAEDRGNVEDDDDDNDNDAGSGGGKTARKPLPFIGKGGLPLL